MDLTVAAIPIYFGSMGAEHRYLKRRRAEQGPSAGDYERSDTIASLSMGVGSVLVPPLMNRVLRPVTPGTGRYGRALVLTAAGAAVVTTIADLVARRAGDALPEAGVVPRSLAGTGTAPGEVLDRGPRDGAAVTGRHRRRTAARLARKISSSASVTAVAAGVVAGTTTWATRTAGERLWSSPLRRGRDRGTGVAATVGAILAFDAIYYWNHRLMHESRYMWAIHVVHHSSERYNLSTALRQPVSSALGAFIPQSGMCLLGFRPHLIETARGVNLLYQYWIHTETIPKLGRLEEVLNTPSHHRVHHGSNRQYLDRNHGSIFIIWDRLFGTFAREEEPVVYGLTKNLGSYNPVRIATHEHADILRDVAGAETWRDRLGFVFRGPGWAYDRHSELHEPQPLAGVS